MANDDPVVALRLGGQQFNVSAELVLALAAEHDAMERRWMRQVLKERKIPALRFEKGSFARVPHYLEFVRDQTCILCKAPPPNDPHHYGRKGLSQKTHDYCTVPLCRLCHDKCHAEPASRRVRLLAGMVGTLVSYLRTVEGR